MSKTLTYKNYTIPAGGATVTHNVETVYGPDIINILGSGVYLTGAYTFSPTGTPVEGTYVKINYEGGVIYDGGYVTIFSYTMTAAEMLAKYTIECTYTNSAWSVKLNYATVNGGSAPIKGSNIIDNTITGSTKLIAGTVSLSKLVVGAARGYFLRAGVSGVWEAANGVTSGNLLMGNGTDVVSQAVTGDVTITGSGVTAIGAGKVTAAMLAYTPQEYFTDELTITSAQILALNGTPLTIVAAPGSGKYIDVISATAQMTYVSAAYATNTTLQLINDGATIAQMQDTAILISTVTKNTKFQQVTAATAGQTQIITNTALQVKVNTGNPTTGDSAIKVSVVYRIVTV